METMNKPKDNLVIEKQKDARRNVISKVTEMYKDDANNIQNVHTPFSLCGDILSKLGEHYDFSGTFLVFNLEFVEVLCHNHGVESSRITFATDCKVKAVTAKKLYAGINLILTDLKKFLDGDINMKFDCVVGNPPYQAPKGTKNEGRGKCGNSLWEKFVEKCFNITKNEGYVSLVHPARWRRPGDKTGDFLKKFNMIFISIHNLDDGMKTFKCQTRYDWYVCQKCDYLGKTTIKDEDGCEKDFDISKMPFIPNGEIPFIMSLVGENTDIKVELIHTYDYETRKPIMSREKTNEFRYPCVYSIDSNGNIKLFYSSVNHAHFKIPKVIFPSGAFQSVNVVIDTAGEYGMTQFCKGIVDSIDNLNKIKLALDSEKFKKLYFKMTMGTTELDKNVIKCFKKDFWKEFI